MQLTYVLLAIINYIAMFALCQFLNDLWLVGVAVRRYRDILMKIITFPYSTCINSFFGSSIPTSLFILKMFFVLVLRRRKNAKWRFFTSRGAHVNCAIMAMLYTHSNGNQP